ncbi:ribosome biogenesis GTPase Der [bacterium]|jgi:GTPase|nr:ribosome biogenesis GTPase Der [bacterium]
MKKKPTVLILGRPNVGKSTLINRLNGGKKAITAEESGTTRDVRDFPVTWNGVDFTVLDSGGLMLSRHSDEIQKKIEELVTVYLDKVDKIIFLTDITTGINATDQTIAKALRKVADKVLIGVNKADNVAIRSDATVFYKLGFGEPFPISAIQGMGVGDLLDALVSDWERAGEEVVDEKQHRIAIVGRPNVGKSSLVNAILNEERVMVDNAAGTTRDAVEVYFKKDDHRYIFIDTAGLRRRNKVVEKIEYFSTLRTARALVNADLVVVVLDANETVSDQDKKIMAEVMKNKRNMIVFVNKWDTTDRTDEARQELEEKLEKTMPGIEYYPILMGSATEKHNLGKLFQLIPEVLAESVRRVPTAELNRFVDQVILKVPPPAKKGKRLKVLYSTQAETSPPTFVFFVNDPFLVSAEYRRFLERRLREFFGGLKGAAVRIRFRSRRGETE